LKEYLKKLKNKFEKKLYRQLKKARAEFKYEGDRIPYILYRDYVPDFTVRGKFGRIYIEAKGYLRPEHRSKMAAVKRQHPEKDIRIVFYSKNKRYIKWAEKLGFKFAIGTIPQEWLEGL
jgi:predicted nuclease of restriction endonuclease-like RecB superfamily